MPWPSLMAVTRLGRCGSPSYKSARGAPPDDEPNKKKANEGLNLEECESFQDFTFLCKEGEQEKEIKGYALLLASIGERFRDQILGKMMVPNPRQLDLRFDSHSIHLAKLFNAMSFKNANAMAEFDFTPYTLRECIDIYNSCQMYLIRASLSYPILVHIRDHNNVRAKHDFDFDIKNDVRDESVIPKHSKIYHLWNTRNLEAGYVKELAKKLLGDILDVLDLNLGAKPEQAYDSMSSPTWPILKSGHHLRDFNIQFQILESQL